MISFLFIDTNNIMDYQLAFNNDEFDFDFDFQREDEFLLLNNDSDVGFEIDVIEDQNLLQIQNDREKDGENHQATTLMKPRRRRRPKEQIMLNEFSMRFYKNMCYILRGNSEESIRKELVLKYHKIACQRNPMIRRVKRKEYRSINRYFNSFVDQQYMILQTFIGMINDGVINYEKDYSVLISKKNL